MAARSIEKEWEMADVTSKFIDERAEEYVGYHRHNWEISRVRPPSLRVSAGKMVFKL
jgi:hypothetical protein